jgi:hypothetical protein
MKIEIETEYNRVPLLMTPELISAVQFNYDAGNGIKQILIYSSLIIYAVDNKHNRSILKYLGWAEEDITEALIRDIK